MLNLETSLFGRRWNTGPCAPFSVGGAAPFFVGGALDFLEALSEAARVS